MKKLYIIGVGPGDEGLVTPRARQAATDCKILYATGRLGPLFPHAQVLSLAAIVAALDQNETEDVAIVVSGDAGFYSLSKSLSERFIDSYDIEICSGISSLQYLAAKMLIPYDDIMTVSLHGREQTPPGLLGLLGRVAYNEKIFVLTGGPASAPNIVCGHLTSAGLGHVRVTVGENLSYANERIVSGLAKELQSAVFSGLTVMLVENPRPIDRYLTLVDDDFTRSGRDDDPRIPMTKEEVRNLAIAKLNIHPTDVVYDVGAGTGSMSVMLSKKACHGAVYAIEKELSALTLLRQNRQFHGAFNVEVLSGAAPSIFETLPPPDAVFIGGSDGQLAAIVEAVLNKNPLCHIVATAITLQTLAALMTMENRCWDIVCLNIARAKHLGSHDLLLAQNPVYVATLVQSN